MNTKLIYEAVYNMLTLANTRLNLTDYEKLLACDSKIKSQILKNAYLAYKNNRPLCQDTGQVVVFLKIGQNIHLEGDFIEDAINNAVKDCYEQNFYRKSVVKDAIFDRTNTKTNTPCVIHTKFQKEDEISVLIGIKGGGAENMTRLKMMNPTSSIDDILEFAKETVKEAEENACPPMIVGIGAGGTAETAAINAKYALFKGKKINVNFANVLETKIISSPTHIASLPVCVNLNCHSIRHMECKIKENKIYYDFNDYVPEKTEIKKESIKINTSNKEAMNQLKDGDKILLTGEIYTARDMAHKKLTEMIQNKEPLPFDLNGAIIFYAGPCPKTKTEIIGPIGPTTSKRMDKYAPLLYEKGVIATIGKGQRTFQKGNRLYFKATGGVANLYQQCITKAELVCFEEFGTEAVYKLTVSDMPLTVERV